MLDLWVGLAALLLLVAAAGGGLALWGARGPWHQASLVARLAAGIALTVALTSAVAGSGMPSPLDLRQVILSLALGGLAADLALAGLLRIEGAGPALDLPVLALVAAALLIAWPAGTPLDCTQRAAPFWLQWAFFLVGAGGALAAGGAGLAWAFQAAFQEARPALQWPPEVESHRLLLAATSLALIGLGAGLAISAWWAWRTVGSLAGGDPRQAWMAITWLFLAMSLLAWQLEGRAGRWSAALAGLGAAATVVGLLVVPYVVQL